MPYNPGSAYPRKTTYVSPVHPNGMGIPQPVNVSRPIMAPIQARVSAARSTIGIMDARAAAASQVYHGATAAAREALSRRGVLDDANARIRERQGLLQNQGGKQPTNFSDVKDRPATVPPAGVVGSSPHIGANPVAKANRQRAEASMDQVVDTVLQSPSMGVGKPTLVIPKWETGRRR